MPAFVLAIVIVYGCVGDDPRTSAPVTPPGDAGTGADASEGPVACEDAKYCDDKCGVALTDKCGVTRDCSTPCGDARKCDGVTCVCASSPTWCQGRCGAVLDNCGREQVCAQCEAGACIAGTCDGCTPEPLATTCAGKACGLAKNNCGQEVDCGTCANSGACNANKCCEPVSTTCAGGRCGLVANNCGQQVSCGGCFGGTTCQGGVCLCADGRPIGAASNCGGCGRDCTGYTCSGAQCFCAEHGTNTDVGSCGPCSSGPDGVGINCSARGFAACSDGVCQ